MLSFCFAPPSSSVIPAKAGIQVLFVRANARLSMYAVLLAVPEPRSGYFSLLVQRKVPKRKHAPDGANSFCASLPLGPSPTYSTFPLRHPAPRKSPGRISLCARSAARMHVKCIRENPASPLCCRSGADVLSAPLAGSPQRQRCSKLRHTGTRNSKTTSTSYGVGGCNPIPLEQAGAAQGCANVARAQDARSDHRRARRGKSRDGVRAQAASSSRARLDRGAQGTAPKGRGSDGGVLSFGDFSLDKQGKVTCVCCTGMYEFRGSAGCAGAMSTTHKYIYYIDHAPTGVPRLGAEKKH